MEQLDVAPCWKSKPNTRNRTNEICKYCARRKDRFCSLQCNIRADFRRNIEPCIWSVDALGKLPSRAKEILPATDVQQFLHQLRSILNASAASIAIAQSWICNCFDATSLKRRRRLHKIVNIIKGGSENLYIERWFYLATIYANVHNGYTRGKFIAKVVTILENTFGYSLNNLTERSVRPKFCASVTHFRNRFSPYRNKVLLSKAQNKKEVNGRDTIDIGV